jgi:hypothetical protein
MTLMGSDAGMDRLRRKYPLQGAGSAMDAVWRPAAHDADMEAQSLKVVPVPAPTPDRGPGVLDFENGSIEIVVQDPSAPAAWVDEAGNAEDPAEAGSS